MGEIKAVTGGPFLASLCFVAQNYSLKIWKTQKSPLAGNVKFADCITALRPNSPIFPALNPSKSILELRKERTGRGEEKFPINGAFFPFAAEKGPGSPDLSGETTLSEGSR